MIIGGKSKTVLLDSGASSSVLDFSTLLSLGHNKKSLNKENIPISVDVSKHFLNVLGTIDLLVKYPCKSHVSNRTKMVRFIVVRSLNIPLILGNDDYKRLQLVSYNCHKVNVLTGAETLGADYYDKKKTHRPPHMSDINLCPPPVKPDISSYPPHEGREPNVVPHQEKFEYGPLLIAPNTIRNLTESIKNGENLNDNIEVDNNVLGNDGLVSNSDID